MKLWLCTALASITLLLVGCYSLLVVNLGVVNKTAAANGTALDPEVACAALAPMRLKIDSNNKIQPDAEKDWMKTCEKVLAQQQQKEPKPKP